MSSTQFLEPYYRYQSLRIIRPDWDWIQKAYNTFQAYTSFFHQRLDTLLFLAFGYFPFKPEILGKKYLAKYLAKGVIFISIHSGPYPLAGKIIKDFYPKLKLVVPFYFHRKFSIFPVFQKFFAKLGIQLVALGGAMQQIKPALEENHSVCLFLDAELPVKNLVEVKLFDQLIPISSGPVWLARTYQRPIVPIYVFKQKKRIFIKVLKPITNLTRPTQEISQQVAASLEQMIDATLSDWQVTDRFLLPQLR